ncbi:hypothetical protein B566_EDAN005965 [Ephemera danica]|nr:hypothetical protein B566_EDAN005965 [Ephemera danica]
MHDITNNIAQIFERFLFEGKCTLRLKEPSVELSINNCDPLQLRLLLKVLKTGHLPDSKDATSNKLVANLPNVHKKLKTSDLSTKGRYELFISTKEELRTSTFTQLLVKLEIVGLGLQQVPPSISKLARLHTLNLSGNGLKTLPPTMTSQLRELNLAGNLLGQTAFKTWNFFSLPQIKNTLQHLDLSSNQLHYIPMDICNLRNLTKLEIKENCIKSFPPTFGQLSKLRTLNLSNNKIETIDTSFQMLDLHTLDISGNRECNQRLLGFRPHPKIVPSLLQAAAVAVAKAKLNAKELPLSLQEDLLALRRCRCLQPVWHDVCSVVPLDLSTITSHLISDTTDKSFFMSAYFCKKATNVFTHIL